MKKRKYQYFACMALLATFITSCTKEPEINKLSYTDEVGGKVEYLVLSFQNETQLNQKILEIERQEDISAYETNLGYASIGRLSDEFFSTIDFSSFSSENEVIEYMEENKKYIDNETEYDGNISYMPKFFHSRYRYVANKDGIYQVGDSIYRLFNAGTVSTTSNHLNELRSLTDDTLGFLNNSPTFRYVPNHERHYVEAVSGVASLTPTAFSEDGCFALPMDTTFVNTRADMRIYSEFTCLLNIGGGPSIIGIDSYCKMNICFGIWIVVKRNIDYNVNTVYHYREYIGGIGPTAYEDECTEYTYSMYENPENSFHHNKPIAGQQFDYRPNVCTIFWFFHSYDPKWYEIIRFTNINITVHAASVSQTILISNN